MISIRVFLVAALLVLPFGPKMAVAQVDKEVVALADAAVGRVMVTLDEGCCAFGSGFVLAPLPNGDGFYFLTNQHVIEGGRSAYVGFKRGDTIFKYDVKVAVSSFEKDMAVLEIRPRKNFDHKPRVMAIREGEITKGEPVAAVGFPGNSDLSNKGRNELALFETTFTQGNVSKVSQGSTMPKRGIQEIVQHTATINKGNSGGPMIDFCGSALGLNTSVAQNTFFASSANSIGRYLRDNSIPFTTHSQACDPDNPKIVQAGQSDDNLWVILAVVCGAGAAVVGGMYFVASKGSAEPVLKSRNAGAAAPSGGAVLALSMAGTNLNLTAAQLRSGVTIGRASENTLTVTDRNLSRRHANLSLQGRKIMLTDLGSSNGTKVDGARLKPNKPVQINTKSNVTLGGIRLDLSRT